TGKYRDYVLQFEYPPIHSTGCRSIHLTISSSCVHGNSGARTIPCIVIRYRIVVSWDCKTAKKEVIVQNLRREAKAHAPRLLDLAMTRGFTLVELLVVIAIIGVL